MSETAFGLPAPDWIQILDDLVEIPALEADRGLRLSHVLRLTRRILGSRACTMALVDLTEGQLKTTECDTDDDEFKQFILRRAVSLEADGPIDAGLVAQREVLERYGLPENGQGVASADVARRYNLQAVLCSPVLKADGTLLGYINHFSATNERFTDETKQILALFARVAAAVIARRDWHRTFERSVMGLNRLSKDLLAVPEELFLNQVAVSVAALLSTAVCIVWQRAEQQQQLRVAAATPSVDDEMRELTLELDSPGVRRAVDTRSVKWIADVRKEQRLYGHSLQAAQRGWVSMLSVPLMVGSRLIGMIDIYTTHERRFERWECEFFGIFANYAALSISEFASRARLLALNKLMSEMTEVRSVDELLRIFLEGALALVRTTRGWISLLDLKTGELRIELPSGAPPHQHTLQWGEGITGQAVERGEPLNVGDVTAPEWKDVYVEFWPDTRSELAIPIMVRDAEVRIGTQAQRGAKPIGVLNVESPRAQAFRASESGLLWSLAQHAAVVIEKLEFDGRLAQLRDIENRMGQVDSVPATAQLILDAVSQTLHYDFVNISLVNAERTRIKTEYLHGIPEDRQEAFKRMADHSLDSDDIQAHVYQQGVAVVPPQKVAPDSAFSFDREIYDLFGHEHLIRVFVPMRLPQGNRVVGTIEAGYNQTYRRFIYERDVNMLQGFADYAAPALDVKNFLHFNFLVAGVLREALAEVRANQGSLLLMNKVTNVLEVIERKGRPFAAGNVRLAVGTGIAGLAVRDRRPYRVADVAGDENFVPPQRGVTNFKSLLVVPIIYGERTVGALCAHHEQANWFTQVDEDRLVTLSRSIAPTIEQLGVDAFVGHTQGLKALERFHNVAEELGRLALYPEKLREEIVKAAETVLEASSVIFYEYFQDRETFATPPTIGGAIREPGVIAGPLSEDRAPHLIVKAGRSHYSIVTAQDDIMRREPWTRSDGVVVPSFVEREGVVSSAGILLKVGDEVMGVLFLNYRTRREFSFTEKHIIGGFAAVAALALQEARAVDEAIAETRVSAAQQNQHRMAHRLKGPLISIDERLREIRDDRVDQATMQQLAAQAVELSRHAQDLLAAFNQPGMKWPSKTVGDVSADQLRKLIERTIKVNRTRKDTQAESTVDAALPAVRIDPEALQDDLINLLHDSERHAKGPSHITLVASLATAGDVERRSLRQGTAFVKLVYEDDGPGVPDEWKERIFEEGESTAGGTGLGLSIARENASRSGGAIVECGQYGRGVRFEMYLPVADHTLGANAV